MDADRWQQIRARFDELIELGADARARRLAALGAADPELRDALVLLLAADNRTSGVLGTPLSPIAREATDPFGLAGRTISHFRVLDPIGAGGMGVVYRAEDTRLGRPVALKLPLPQLQLDAAAKERFLREARSAAALDHPNLCTIHEVGESEDGRLFLAMPLYAGETLRARLDRDGRLPIREAVAIARQVAQGLACAHAAGIVHRDLKPANLMLLPDGMVKILDFGLAKARETGLTASRVTPGTVAYMAPEQIWGKPVDARADLWAVGVVLYEMLTGQRPFAAETDIAVAHAIVSEMPVRPTALRAEIPAALEEVVLGLLAREPHERSAAAADTAEALGKLRTAEAQLSPHGRWYRRSLSRRRGLARAAVYGAGVLAVGAGLVSRRTVLIATAVLALGGALGAGWLWRLPGWRAKHATTEPTRIDRIEEGSIAVLPFTNMSGDPEQEYFSDGVSEEILNALSRLPQLRVANRTSAFAFKRRPVGIDSIARALRVAYVLEGSVRKEGDDVRVTAQLINAATGYRVFSETYDRNLKHLFAVQDEIARAVASRLQLTLAPAGAASLQRDETFDPEAHVLLLRSLALSRTMVPVKHIEAIRLLREALRRDPSYARAHAQLSIALVWAASAWLRLVPHEAGSREAIQEANRALALDSALPEAHFAAGWAADADWNWREAEAQYRRALELNPSYGPVHERLAGVLALLYSVDDGLADARRAVELDPLSPLSYVALGNMSLFARRFPESLRAFSDAEALSPGAGLFPGSVAIVYCSMRRPEDAARALARVRPGGPGDPWPAFMSAFVAACVGRRAQAQAALRRLESFPHTDGGQAIIQGMLGNNDRAFALLPTAIARRDRYVLDLFLHPELETLRDDPRMSAMLRMAGLPERRSR